MVRLCPWPQNYFGLNLTNFSFLRSLNVLTQNLTSSRTDQEFSRCSTLSSHCHPVRQTSPSRSPMDPARSRPASTMRRRWQSLTSRIIGKFSVIFAFLLYRIEDWYEEDIFKCNSNLFSKKNNKKLLEDRLHEALKILRDSCFTFSFSPPFTQSHNLIKFSSIINLMRSILSNPCFFLRNTLRPHTVYPWNAERAWLWWS